jgi:hypothetical protein
MKTQPKPQKFPTFVNIHDLKETPPEPVIPYFTKDRWGEFISRQRLQKRSTLPLNQFQVRYQLVPWGSGEVMVYPNPLFARYVLSECKPILKVVVHDDPLYLKLIHVGFECKIERLYCTAYIEAYPGEIPKGVNGIGCDDEHCRNGCRQIFVGTQTEGYFTCTCRKPYPR